jgi:hypothetical protein
MRPILKLGSLCILTLVVSLAGQRPAQAVGSCVCNTNQDCYICTGGHPDSIACFHHKCEYLPG